VTIGERLRSVAADRRMRDAVWLLGILGVAAFYRFFRLHTLPPGLYPDEAMNGNDALASLDSGRFAVFYPENYGREGLFIWIVALSLKLLGTSVQALRGPSAVIGTLTIAAMYLLASELYGRRVAVLSSSLAAVSFWHVDFSRMGLRGILVPLLLSLAFGVLLHGLRTRRASAVILAGVLFGVGAYTYVAFRAAFVLLAVTLLLVPREGWPAAAGTRSRGPHLARGWLPGAFLVTVGLVALPLVTFSLRHPDEFDFRLRRVSVMAAEDAPEALWRSTFLTARMFFVRGDGNPRHSYRRAPVLPLVVSPFFGLGLALAVKRAVSSRKGGRAEARPSSLLGDRRRALFLLSWMAIMALPVVLTGRGVPHALRSIGMLPAVFILAASGLVAVADAAGRIHRVAPLALSLCVVGAAAVQGYRAYFVEWGGDPSLREAFRQDLVEKAEYLKTLSSAARAYVVANGRGLPAPYPDGPPMPAQTLLFLLHEDCARPAPAIACPTFVSPPGMDSLEVDPRRPNAFVLLKDDSREASRLSRRFPRGVWRRLDDSTVYTWPR
jgi:4-amino-4-deoxy-L-arabinose transferase-like glycosyltransferase